MSDNPNPPATPETELPGYGVIALRGVDCAAFAQSQFMNDVAELADQHWQWNGWLSPKGRVRALFALLRLDAQTLWMVTTVEIELLATELARFRFRSKLTIDALPCYAAGRFARPSEVRGALLASTQGFVELDLSSDGGERTLCIGAKPPASAAIPAADGGTNESARASIDADVQRWWARDIAHGWPGVPGAALDAWTPQQLSLGRLNAFSVRKGCYPGQEIVARTHFLGRAKRGLVRLDGIGVRGGAAVTTAAGDAVGTVVGASGDSGLAVLPLDLDATVELRADGESCKQIPLRGGLQR